MTRLTVLMAVVMTLALAGCNTIHGMGQDIQKAGGAISGASQKK